VVIQGFGNVGGMAARLMSKAGFKIICVAEIEGAVITPRAWIQGTAPSTARNRVDLDFPEAET
jgi:glutamate dehydrogenase (NAD(P)+)